MDEEYSAPSGDIAEAAAPVEQAYEAPQEQSVPLTALQAERAQRQQLQDELRMYREHMALMQSNQQQPQHLENDDDIMTKGEVKQYLQQLNNHYQTRFNEMEMVKKHPDYEEVVTKYLPEVIKANPRLRDTLTATNDYELAYYLATQTDAYRAAKKKDKRHEDADRIIKNSQAPGNLSNVGSMSPVTAAKQYKSMSDDEFRAVMNRNLGQY